MTDKRKHKRIPFSMKLWCSSYHDPAGELQSFTRPVFMDIFDMSIGGLGIICKHDFAENSILHFTLYLEERPYEVMALVRWIKKDSCYHKLGTMFVGSNNALQRHLEDYINENDELDKKTD